MFFSAMMVLHFIFVWLVLPGNETHLAGTDSETIGDQSEG